MVPVTPLVMGNALQGPLPTIPMMGAQGTTKPLCLCNLQREKDAERLEKKKRPGG
jgi:hypothetical protein